MSLSGAIFDGFESYETLRHLCNQGHTVSIPKFSINRSMDSRLSMDFTMHEAKECEHETDIVSNGDGFGNIRHRDLDYWMCNQPGLQRWKLRLQ